MQRLVRSTAIVSRAKFLVNLQKATLSSLPSHKVVPMPALSPTMEIGSISRWILKEGDKFEPGSAICEVETDKATVSFDATDEGYIAKILVGAGEVKVGQPLMITVEEASEVAPFANYQVSATAQAVAPAAPVAAPKAEAPKPAAPSAPAAVATSSASRADGDRVVASPFARKLARESGVDLSSIKNGSGPGGRIIAEDVMKAASMPKQATAAPSAQAAPARAAPAAAPVSTAGVAGVFQDFTLSEYAQSVAARHTHAKQVVPHYYLSVELNLGNVLKLRDSLNKQLSAGKKSDASSALSVQDFLVKAAALSMKQVPDVNASWCDTFIRRYSQVDVNLVMGTGNYLATPLLRDVGSKGLSTLSTEIAAFEDNLGDDSAPSASDVGTFSIHNLGIYGVKSAAPIVLTPQACALSLGAIVDTVVPRTNVTEGGDNWEVAPVLTATLSCDHRVVDGAVGAQWLSAYKSYIENPTTMLL